MAKAKILKKQWYLIVAPKLFRNVALGETLVYEPEQMMGKSITQNLMNLTNDVRRQNININFEVVNVENGKGFTNIVGYNMVKSSVKRMVRRNINKIDMSFVCSTSDKKNVRIKPLLITRSPISGSVEAKIRKNAQDFLTKYIGNISYDNFTNDLISHKLQNYLRAHLKKVYPLKVCEIRSMQISKVHEDAEPKKAKSQKKKPKNEIKEEVKTEKKIEEAKEVKKEEKSQESTEKIEKEPSQAA